MADIVTPDKMQDFLSGKYETTVSISPGLCILNCPPRKDALIPQRQNHYSIVKYSLDDLTYNYGISILKFNKHGDKIKDEILNMPIYALRPYIICDIVGCCVLRGYPYSLVKFESEGNTVEPDDLFNIFELPESMSTKEIIEKENSMREMLLSGGYNNEEEQIHNYEEIEEGFQMLYNLFLET